jgi:hypothetical protein
MILDGFIFLINHASYRTLNLIMKLYGSSKPYLDQSKSV